jgi:hypothetical protein
MQWDGIITAKIHTHSKCVTCGEPIVAGEGVAKVSSVWRKSNKSRYGYMGKGFLCYKCACKNITSYIKKWESSQKMLDSCNLLTQAQLDEKKIPKML